MMLWAAFAVMTAVAVIVLLVPLGRSGRRGAAPAATAIYAEQLGEIDRDLARGLIGAEEAAAARAEVGRRLIRADEAESGADAAAGAAAEGAKPSARRGPRILAVAVVVLVPLSAVAVYLAAGAPGLPDAPLVDRRAAAANGQDIADLVARVETRLRENPGDGRGWAVIAPVYLRMGRAADAAAAYRNAIRHVGDDAGLESGLGAALTALADGVVTRDARLAFERARALDPAAVEPRFYLAVALGQEGDTEAARAAWTALIGSAAGNEPWLPAARAELAALGGEPAAAPGAGPTPPAATPGEAPATPTLPGPSTADAEAAAVMSEEDRAAMIAGMVDSLAARLSADGGSPEEWLRLVRAYAVLGRSDDARRAVAEARRSLAADPAAVARVDAGAAELDLD